MNVDFIGIYDNALSSDQCKEIVSYMDESELERGAFGEHSSIDASIKDCWEMKGIITDGSAVSNSILGVIQSFTSVYRKDYESIDEISNWNIVNDYNLQKYEPGQGYHALHCEASNIWSAPRVLAWMIYLNTVEDGGGTSFPSYDKVTDAVEGRFLIWPSYWTHVHKGIVSPTEKKYIATGWYGFLSK